MKIDGKKITLRDLQTKDLEPLGYWMDPKHKWHETDGPYYPRTTLEEIPQVIKNFAEAIELGKFSSIRKILGIVDQKTDLLIGKVNRYWISEETNWMAIGIGIYDPENWGQGLGAEALQLWSDYLFQADPTLARLDLRTWSGNPGMMRLAEKVGYKKEAVFRDARIVNGLFYDGLGYGILRAEWEKLRD